MRRLGQPVEASADVKPGDESQRFSMHAFGAVFVEVAVDPDLGETRVRRIVGAYGAGRIVNPKTTRSQCIGGMIGGIGMALMEHSVVDARNGRVPNANFAEYAVPVHADAPPVMDVIFVEEHDPHVNPLGVKGVGEIAMVGVAPAITNAIFHATGKRIRELPVTPDKLPVRAVATRRELVRDRAGGAMITRRRMLAASGGLAALAAAGQAPAKDVADDTKESTMEITRNGSQPSGKGPADYFTGAVRVDPLFQARDPARVAAPASRSSRARARRGTRIRSARP